MDRRRMRRRHQVNDLELPPGLRSGLDEEKNNHKKTRSLAETWHGVDLSVTLVGSHTYSLHHYHQPPVCHHHRESKTTEAGKEKSFKCLKVYSYWLPALPTTSTWLAFYHSLF